MENAISNLEFGGGEGPPTQIWGGKCIFRSKFSTPQFREGGKFGVENVISNLEFGGWKIWGGKCYLESPIFGVRNLGWKIFSPQISNSRSNFPPQIFHPPNSRFEIAFSGGKCYLESRIWGVENLGRKMLSRISNLGGEKFGVENAISNLEFGG